MPRLLRISPKNSQSRETRLQPRSGHGVASYNATFKWLHHRRVQMAAGFILLAGILALPHATAQFPSPSASPSALQTSLPEPPRDIPLVEKKWEELSDKNVGEYGEIALAIRPEKWKHAETANFIIHFRRVTEAHPVVREIEYDLWFVAKTLGATREQCARKSHVFVFADEVEWNFFISKLEVPSWFRSFAHSDGLFLNVRQQNGIMDSHILAHETTHAVVARIYRLKHAGRWPVWLNEGFAEHMGSASVAARSHLATTLKERDLKRATVPLDELTKTTKYPEDPLQVAAFYQSSEKLVRFLMTKSPPARFPKFVDAILDGKTLQEAVVEIYGDQYKDFDTFEKKYQLFTK
jgi:hypothetical protein